MSQSCRKLNYLIVCPHITSFVEINSLSIVCGYDEFDDLIAIERYLMERKMSQAAGLLVYYNLEFCIYGKFDPKVENIFRLIDYRVKNLKNYDTLFNNPGNMPRWLADAKMTFWCEIESISSTRLSDDEFNIFLSKVLRAPHKSLKRISGPITQENFDILSRKCPNLEQLDFTYPCKIDLRNLSSFTNVKKISFNLMTVYQENIEHLINFFALRGHNLRSLKLDLKRSNDSELLNAIRTNCRGLKHLLLRPYDRSDEQVQAVFDTLSNLPSLKEIRLVQWTGIGGGSIPETDIEHLKNNLKKLVRFDQSPHF